MRNYYTLSARPREQFEKTFGVDVLDEEIKALHRLIQEKRGKADDRRFAVEVQFARDISLHEHRPLAVILPETYLRNSAYRDRIVQTGAEVISYPVYPLRKEYYYYAIYEKLDEFYTRNGMYDV